MVCGPQRTTCILPLAVDFDARTRLLYFPSVLHVVGASSDKLKIVALLGSLASAVGIVSPSPRAFAVAWIAYQSFTVVGGLVLWLPWDGMLLEAGMLCALSPTNADGPPTEVRFGFSWLVFRVLVGFGKHKFIGSAASDSQSYVRRFLVFQPNPSVVGWSLVHRLLGGGEVLASLSYAFFLAVELGAAPCLLLRPCLLRRLAAHAILLLMAAIQLCGNFGWFNLLVAACVLPAAVARTRAVDAAGSLPVPRVRIAAIAAWAVLSLPFALPSQWCSPGLLWWDSVDDAWGTSTSLACLRVASAWRLVHTYGVFPPTLPSGATHFTTRWEVSANGRDWVALGFGSRPSTTDERPAAPLSMIRWSRLDYFSFYDAHQIMFTPSVDIAPATAIKSVFSHRHRFAWALLTNSSALERRMRILEGGRTGDLEDWRDLPVRYVRAWRVRLFPVHAAKEAEYARAARRCGAWACETVLQVHLRSCSLGDLTRRFGPTPHHEHGPTPEQYGAHSLGYAKLARPRATRMALEGPSAAEGAAGARIGMPLRRLTKNGKLREMTADAEPISCHWASHLIPSRYHPSTCLAALRLSRSPRQQAAGSVV